MMRLRRTALVCLLLVCVGPIVCAHAVQRLSTPAEAQQLGLRRAWFAQVRLDPARSQVERAILEGDRLSVLTTAGLLHEFNALTGETIWVAPFGNPDYPSLGPAASDQYIALLNGSTLYVLDRADGRPAMVREVGGAPGAAPAVNNAHAFVPLVRGRIEAYPINQQTFRPWYYQSFGRTMVPPIATPKSFVWTTDSGHLYVGRSEELAVRYRLETGSEIAATPAYYDPYIYVGTTGGELFAMHELTGARRWKYSTGYAILRAPAALKDYVYFTTEEPALHCVDAETGAGIWEARRISQFAAASKNRVYGVDDIGRIVALDAATGALVARIPTDGQTKALVNDQTDRVYLVSDDGVVQCFHEVGSDQPLYHRAIEATPPPDSETAPEAAASDAPTTETPPETAPSFFDEPLPEDQPPAEAPAGDSDAEEDFDNPFDFD